MSSDVKEFPEAAERGAPPDPGDALSTALSMQVQPVEASGRNEFSDRINIDSSLQVCRVNAAMLFTTLEEHKVCHQDGQKRMEELELQVMKVGPLEKQVSENTEAVTQLNVTTSERLCDLENRVQMLENAQEKNSSAATPGLLEADAGTSAATPGVFETDAGSGTIEKSPVFVNKSSHHNPVKSRRCKNLPGGGGMCDPQAVAIRGRICVTGGNTADAKQEPMVYIYDFEFDGWDMIEAPVRFSAVTSYHDKLTLLGGREAIEDELQRTDKVWVYDDSEKVWDSKAITRMTSKRSSASAKGFDDYIVVVGGLAERWADIDLVEVYVGQQRRWVEVDRLPITGYVLRSVCCNGYLYFMGGYPPNKSVFHCHLEELIKKATHLTHLPKTTEPLWKPLPDVPYELSSAVVFGNSLYSAGGWDGRVIQNTLFQYDAKTLSWKLVGELPEAVYAADTIALPTGETVLIGGRTENVLCSPFVYTLQL